MGVSFDSFKVLIKVTKKMIKYKILIKYCCNKKLTKEPGGKHLMRMKLIN